MSSIFENVHDINSIPVKETVIMSDRTSQIVGEPFMLHMHIAMPGVLGPGTLRTFNINTQ